VQNELVSMRVYSKKVLGGSHKVDNGDITILSPSPEEMSQP